MFSLLFMIVSCKNKAVIVAGSYGWGNYRHQADAWAVYQELIKRNFDKNDIRLLCYDDIANNPLNKFKGKIFHDLDHKTNVYGGSELINYKDRISRETFKEALFDLKGTENDNLFIFYIDHGNAGVIGIPNEDIGEMRSPYIADIFLDLHKNKAYKNCIFFILACLSGSIGEYVEEKLIESNIKNTAIITSSRNNESSMGSYYDPWIDITISSQFSIAFIDKIREDPDCKISDLFNYLLSNVKYSSPCYYGDENIKEMKISDFIGTTSSVESNHISRPNPITDEMFDKMRYEITFNEGSNEITKMKIKSQYKKSIEKTQSLMNLLNKISLKLNSRKKTSQIKNHEDEFKVTDDYFEILDHFNNLYGIIPTHDRINVSLFLLKLSKITSKKKVIECIDEIFKNN